MYNLSVKDKFIKYIGPKDSLANYSRSYKIVFLITFFELLDDQGMAKTIEVARDFKRFYENRKQIGLIPDSDVEPRVENIENSSVSQVLSMIKDNPYKVINDKGFVNLKTIDDVEYFCLDRDLHMELEPTDRKNIIEILKDKLDLYYSKIDNGTNTINNPVLYKNLIEKFMKSYVSLRTSTPFGKNPIGEILTNKLPKIIAGFNFIDKDIHVVKGSYGNGNWTHTPWLAVFDKRITQTAQEGVYIVYIFSSDMTKVYLTLNQGCTKLKNASGKKEAIKVMQSISNDVRHKINVIDFSKDNNLYIGHELYEKGSIFYKAYDIEHIPEDAQLISDLKRMMDIYQEYYQKIFNNLSETEHEEINIIKMPPVLNAEFNVKEEVERISSYIISKGFTYEDDLIMNFYLALKSKPFVILAGTSGTGKSKLARLFAEAVGATSENGRFKLIAVRPDWSDSTDLLGYRDLNGKFNRGVLTDVILRANDTPEEPFFVCLDEMNLARVEYYLSDVLSIMESRKWSSDRIVTDTLISKEHLENSDKDAKKEVKDIIIPDNFYIIGTVNMDETTFPFSKKVLDRANTIEFSYVDLEIRVEKADEQQHVALHNSFLRSEYLLLEDCMEYEEKLNETISILKEINNVLQPANLHFGYRVRDEICFYIIYNHMYDLLPFNQAMDKAILQKILPRIQGSSISIKRLLVNLFKICINNSSQLFSYETSSVNEEMFIYMKENSISFNKSAEKIAFMMRRFEEDGFTSYWL